MTVCVYAIVAPGIGRIGMTGIAGERLRPVRAGSIAAVVGEPPRKPRPTEANLRHYDRVMRALSRRVPALLPARFGSCSGSLDELALNLRARERVLRRGLAAVRGRVQMTVRLIDSDATRDSARTPAVEAAEVLTGHRAPHLPDRESRVPGPESGVAVPESPGVAYLHARAAATARARAVPPFEPLRPAVQKWVREERVEKHRNIATLYHLVPRAAADRYRRALERAARHAGVRIVVSGPWPAYAFTEGW